jgi:hypothetical protein
MWYTAMYNSMCPDVVHLRIAHLADAHVVRSEARVPVTMPLECVVRMRPHVALHRKRSALARSSSHEIRAMYLQVPTGVANILGFTRRLEMP